MLKKKFETWPTDFIFIPILLAFSMHIINLSYLEDETFYIMELLDRGTEELDLELSLNHAAAISNNNNQPLPNLSNLEVERAKKKAEKIWTRQLREITLVQVISSAYVDTPSATITSSSLSAVFGDSLLFVLTGDTSIGISIPLTAGGGPLSASSGGCSTFAISGSSPLFLVANTFGSRFTVSSGGHMSPVTDTISSVSAISDNSIFSLITNDGPLSLIVGDVSPSADLPALFLSRILSHVHCLSWAFLATLLISSTMAITGKRLFNKAFYKRG